MLFFYIGSKIALGSKIDQISMCSGGGRLPPDSLAPPSSSIFKRRNKLKFNLMCSETYLIYSDRKTFGGVSASIVASIAESHCFGKSTHTDGTDWTDWAGGANLDGTWKGGRYEQKENIWGKHNLG